MASITDHDIWWLSSDPICSWSWLYCCKYFCHLHCTHPKEYVGLWERVSVWVSYLVLWPCGGVNTTMCLFSPFYWSSSSYNPLFKLLIFSTILRRGKNTPSAWLSLRHSIDSWFIEQFDFKLHSWKIQTSGLMQHQNIHYSLLKHILTRSQFLSN